MCNDYANRIPYNRYVEEFSHLKLPVFVQGNGPDLTPRDDIRIRDTAPIILRTGDGVELTERVWAPRAANKKPSFNFRSEKRPLGIACGVRFQRLIFSNSQRRPIPSRSAKTNGRFTVAGADWFCLAGIVRPDAIDGEACFTMLTTEPEADVAPYHDRQIVVLRREDWAAWLDLARPEAELLRALPTGSLKA